MHPYLYLAPRGQAKTYEAINFAVSKSRGGFKTAIFNYGDRASKNTAQKATKLLDSVENIEFYGDLSKAESIPLLTVRIFDEFDLLFQNFSGEFKIRSTDRFYGTPLQKRNLAKPKDNDILLKILSATNGHYHGRMWAECLDKNTVRKIKAEMPKDQFDLEFLGSFWEVE